LEGEKEEREEKKEKRYRQAACWGTINIKETLLSIAQGAIYGYINF